MDKTGGSGDGVLPAAFPRPPGFLNIGVDDLLQRAGVVLDEMVPRQLATSVWAGPPRDFQSSLAINVGLNSL